jgi:hypothetical protein
VLAATVLALSAACASALADVDPASDVLLLQNVSLPYSPKVCSGLSDSLRSLTDKAKNAGYPIKVALIGDKSDLGGAPQFDGQPKPYAKFLGNELGVYGPDVGRDYSTNLHLLTVMPAGFGFYQSGGNSGTTPPGVQPGERPGATNSDGLARAAIDVIPKIAKAAGKPIAAENASTVKCSGGGGGFPTVLVFALPVALLVAGGFALHRVQGRRGEA